MRRLTLVLLPVLLAGAACGVPTQHQPEPVGAPALERTAAPGATLGAQEVQVWFVRGRHLEAVSRPVTPGNAQTALDALVAGPTPEEADGGLRTALTTEPLRCTGPASGSSIVDVTVPRGFTGLVGGNQQLAVAQVVWTVTQFPGVEEVRFTGDGKALEVPTDEGLTADPVSRGDHRSLLPEPTGAPAPTGAAVPSSPPPAPPTPARRRPGAGR